MELAVTKRQIDSKDAKKPKLLREEGVLPAVVYGRSEESTPISIDRKAFEKVFKAAGESSIITLTGLDSTKQALIQDVSVHPVSGVMIHADFYAIEKGQKVTVSVPLEFDGVSPAVKELGGILTKVLHEIEMEVDPSELPHAIHVDISKLVTLEDQIKVSDLTFPASAKLSVDQDEVVAIISVAKEEVEETAPMDISQIETSVERGKKEEEGTEGAAPAEPAAKEKKE
ncbi:50S ribosomal protein L25 [Candidatus Kaiserbacteria bacterium]|nr:50S ribosomal protein L25 [Candidatus Kaiserbacteria bacterium]